jgi:hypothetical protein
VNTKLLGRCTKGLLAATPVKTEAFALTNATQWVSSADV